MGIFPWKYKLGKLWKMAVMLKRLWAKLIWAETLQRKQYHRYRTQPNIRSMRSFFSVVLVFCGCFTQPITFNFDRNLNCSLCLWLLHWCWRRTIWNKILKMVNMAAECFLLWRKTSCSFLFNWRQNCPIYFPHFRILVPAPNLVFSLPKEER